MQGKAAPGFLNNMHVYNLNQPQKHAPICTYLHNQHLLRSEIPRNHIPDEDL